MHPVVSIVGKSGAGKTTLIEQMIAEFKRRGYQIATVKHSRRTIEIDQPGKDSWRFARAGSDGVVLNFSDKITFTKTMDHDSSIEEISHLIDGDFDLILTEGFRSDIAPKIEVYKRELGEDLLCPAEELSAIITDEPLDVGLPQLPTTDIGAIVDFIEENFVSGHEEDTSLFINGKPIFLNRFLKEIVANIALGIASALHGVGEIRNLDISVRRKR
jgi:molybdopterin-guanine dinucleotide biosynthesis protein MobB